MSAIFIFGWGGQYSEMRANRHPSHGAPPVRVFLSDGPQTAFKTCSLVLFVADECRISDETLGQDLAAFALPTAFGGICFYFIFLFLLFSHAQKQHTIYPAFDLGQRRPVLLGLRSTSWTSLCEPNPKVPEHPT